MVALLPAVPITGGHEQCGFSAIKIAAHGLTCPIVAPPGPVLPGVAFIAHAPPTVPLGAVVALLYIKFRTFGDVVEHPVIELPSNVAPNIKTAALGVSVVIPFPLGLGVPPGQETPEIPDCAVLNV